MDGQKILDFIAETGLLKRVKRSGWWVAGVPEEESVAEHSFRCAVIGYILAKEEKADPYEVLKMTLFNDLHESRINDLHKIVHRYVDVKDSEKKAFNDQVRALGGKAGKELKKTRDEYDAQSSLESLVARDADILECLVQAKEYLDRGFPGAAEFLKKGPEHLRTDSARSIWKALRKWDSRAWWRGLAKFER